MTGLIAPLFAERAPAVMAVLTALLCCSTYLLYGGGTARLIASMADEGAMPRVLARRDPKGVPQHAVGAIMSVHVAVLLLVVCGIFDVERLVAVANVFFLANVSIGVAAGIVCLRRGLSA